MNEEAKALRREYHRNWQRAHKDKVKEYTENYWERKAAQASEVPAEGEQAPGVRSDSGRASETE